jgi:hypothetical protein
MTAEAWTGQTILAIALNPLATRPAAPLSMFSMENKPDDMQQMRNALTRLEDMRDDLPVYSYLDRKPPEPRDWIDDAMDSFLSDILWTAVAAVLVTTLLFWAFK